LVTDAMMACAMPDGMYALGGQDVVVKDGAARLLSGSLAGSILTLDKAIKNVYRNVGLPLYEAVKMATFNAARHCKVQDRKGLIREGYDADLVLFDEDISIKNVIVSGKVIV
ncbi:amidohydrolase family protein, partial [Clostridium perfringens]|uniref:amidohydrolase family protein n=1 Tax=Clostridium perfringens TaxID=1502 RepID=UPI002AC384BF